MLLTCSFAGVLHAGVFFTSYCLISTILTWVLLSCSPTGRLLLSHQFSSLPPGAPAAPCSPEGPLVLLAPKRFRAATSSPAIPRAPSSSPTLVSVTSSFPAPALLAPSAQATRWVPPFLGLPEVASSELPGPYLASSQLLSRCQVRLEGLGICFCASLPSSPYGPLLFSVLLFGPLTVQFCFPHYCFCFV